ncbi:hypothetical protein [Aestuariivirga sp.]|uniref:hypothetical protein n=1 Tax=Aestuariivirga sp. TaxID=2650926 RepID=UPI0035947E7F
MNMTVRIDLVTVLALAAALSGPSTAQAALSLVGDPYRLAQAAPPLEIPGPTPEGASPMDQLPATAAPPGEVPAVAPPPPAVAPDLAMPQAGPETEDGGQVNPDEPATDDGDSPDEELSLGEIPIIETIELTPDLAKRALDSYLLARDKYANSDLDQYANLQDFVDQTPEGKSFEADIKAAGFANVTEWNLAITTLGVMYGSVADDQTSDLLLQISEIESDTELAQDIKDRMVNALKAMIPSENNKKVIEDLMADPDYGPKLKQLDIEEE